jgi:hypothetical protein
MHPINVLSIGTIDELSERLPHRRPHFLLFLAWDAPDMPQEKLVELFRPLVDRGLVYFCAWGAKCEAVHDAVDRSDTQKHYETGTELSADSILLTTWHTRDSLAKAIWYFKVCALPAKSFDPANCDRFAVAVGNSDWAAELESAVLSIEGDTDDEVEPIDDDEED